LGADRSKRLKRAGWGDAFHEFVLSAAGSAGQGFSLLVLSIHSVRVQAVIICKLGRRNFRGNGAGIGLGRRIAFRLSKIRAQDATEVLDAIIRDTKV
jgi:hypothetical protein